MTEVSSTHSPDLRVVTDVSSVFGGPSPPPLYALMLRWYMVLGSRFSMMIFVSEPTTVAVSPSSSFESDDQYVTYAEKYESMSLSLGSDSVRTVFTAW